MAFSPYDLLHQIARTEAKLRLVNVYKGVPIASEAVLVALDKETVTVEVDRYQLVCLYHDRQTFLQSLPLPEILRAQVMSLDTKQLRAVLGHLQVMRSRVGDRMNVRVHPKDLIEGEVLAKDVIEHFVAELADISIDGLGIYIQRAAYSSRLLPVGANVVVHLRLPGNYQLVERRSTLDFGEEQSSLDRFDRQSVRMSYLSGISRSDEIDPPDLRRRYVKFPTLKIQGSIVNIRDDAPHPRFRLGIRTRPDDPSRPILNQFISQRQSEIIRELRDVSALLESEGHT